jgi:hypothetical protein
LAWKKLKGVWELMGGKPQDAQESKTGKVCEPELKQQVGKLEPSYGKGPKIGKVRKHG